MVRLLTLEEIQTELLEIFPTNSGPLILPYEEGQGNKQKLKSAYQSLRRSIERKDCLTTLVNAYFLGKVLNETEGLRQEFQLKRELTSHYITMAENAYTLFEIDSIQILCTTKLDIRDVQQIRRQNMV